MKGIASDWVNELTTNNTTARSKDINFSYFATYAPTHRAQFSTYNDTNKACSPSRSWSTKQFSAYPTKGPHTVDSLNLSHS